MLSLCSDFDVKTMSRREDSLKQRSQRHVEERKYVVFVLERSVDHFKDGKVLLRLFI